MKTIKYVIFIIISLNFQVVLISQDDLDSVRIRQIAMEAVRDTITELKIATEKHVWETMVKSKIDSILLNPEVKSFDFVGGGDLNSIRQSGESTTAGNISLGLYYLREFHETKFFRDIEIDLALNIATTADSFMINGDPRSFGNYILNPINTRQSARLDFYSLFKDPEGEQNLRSIIIDGAFLRFYGSNSTWTFDQTPISTTAVHFKIGLFHEFLPDEVARKNNSSVMLGLAWSLRAIAGDMVANDKALLKEILNTEKSVYKGFDFVFGVKFNNIRGEFLLPLISNKGDLDIPGLTNSQFITQVRFIGGFPLGLNRSREIADEVKKFK